MKPLDRTYGELIRLDPNDNASAETLQRLPLGASAAQGGVDEAFLQDLLFRFPETLPTDAIDAAYAGAVPVCRELSTQAGYVDALYMNRLGRLTLAEFKLWRNPQARREVIGQILDYAKELASWGYEDLQREVSRTLKRTGNVLYELVREQAPDEAAFVDRVTRHLKRGEFLLLIVGDGIREDVEHIVDFVQRHSGLHFNLALVEAALYRDRAGHIIVQPRVLARTEIVRRDIVEAGLVAEGAGDNDDREEALSEQEASRLRFWSAVVQDYAFSDPSVDVPSETKEPSIYVKVRHSGHGGWALCFAGFLQRSRSLIGCYLTCRKDIPYAVRIYEEIEASLEELRGEMGADLDRWVNDAGRPRVGFRRQTKLTLQSDDGTSEDFREAVSWMRDHLNVLVSTLHPRLQRMISDAS